MAASKPLSKQDILRAMRVTKSNMAASRYLNVSYNHYRKYAKSYFDGDKTLFELHLNESGKGIPKFQKHARRKPDINKILSGELWIEHYKPEQLKQQLIHEHIFPEECGRCGFKEKRVSDFKIPLLLNYKDTNRTNWKKENLEFLCYNCYFINIGDLFNNKEIKNIEDYNKSEEPINDKWEMDEDMRNHLIDLGLMEDDNSNKDGEEFRDYK
jgi:hypothetical protein